MEDLCESCGKRVANHETDHGLLCDKCFKEIYPKGESKVKTSILAIAILFSVIPSNARAQASVNSAPSVYDSTKGVTSVGSHQSINSDQGVSSPSNILFRLQPTHPVETGSKNDSVWTGPNLFVTLEEAMKLAEQERLKTANNTLSIAEAAKKAKEEAAKAKASNPSKTEMVAMQDANGNVVYVRRVRKP